jgi:hypothetical protein
MKFLKRFKNESDYQTFKEGENFVTPNISLCGSNGEYKLVFNGEISYPEPEPEPEPVVAGDVAYWDGSKVKTTPLSSWNTSLGTAIGVVVVPEGFAPDGKIRIVSLMGVDKYGNILTSRDTSLVYAHNFVDLSLTNYQQVPITDNAGSTSSGSDSWGYLPSDKFIGATSFVDPKAKYYEYADIFIPSPYLGDEPNPEYYKTLDGDNTLSDFNGLSNTQTLVGLGTGYTAANACWKYKDGVSNLQWYLPAMGELGCLMVRFKTINNVITTLGGVAIDDSYYWSSSECHDSSAYTLGCGYGVVNRYGKEYGFHMLPFAILE